MLAQTQNDTTHFGRFVKKHAYFSVLPSSENVAACAASSTTPPPPPPEKKENERKKNEKKDHASQFYLAPFSNPSGGKYSMVQRLSSRFMSKLFNAVFWYFPS